MDTGVNINVDYHLNIEKGPELCKGNACENTECKNGSSCKIVDPDNPDSARCMDESALSCDTKQGNSDCNSDANCMWDPGESKCVGLCPVIPGGDSEKRYAGKYCQFGEEVCRNSNQDIVGSPKYNNTGINDSPDDVIPPDTPFEAKCYCNDDNKDPRHECSSDYGKFINNSGEEEYYPCYELEWKGGKDYGYTYNSSIKGDRIFTGDENSPAPSGYKNATKSHFNIEGVNKKETTYGKLIDNLSENHIVDNDDHFYSDNPGDPTVAIPEKLKNGYCLPCQPGYGMQHLGNNPGNMSCDNVKYNAVTRRGSRFRI